MAVSDWGDHSTQILAGAAVLALIASVAAAIIFNKQLGVQQEQLELLRADLKRQDDERERGQASAVSAWIERFDPQAGSVIYSIRNWSDEPIWHVYALIDSHWAPTHVTSEGALHIVPPKETLQLSIDVEMPKVLSTTPPIRIQFDDASGRVWRRNERGHLHQFTWEGDRPPFFTEWGNDWGD